MMRTNGKDRIRWFVLAIIGIGFVLGGVNSIVRNFCLNQASYVNYSVQHPQIINTCISATSPLAYFVGIVQVLAGLYLLFIERVMK